MNDLFESKIISYTLDIFNNKLILDLTSINLSNDRIDISLDCPEESWLKHYKGYGEIVLEVWSKLVILEADKIKINDIEYDLK